MQTTIYKTAYEDPATRRAWRGHMARRILRLVLWIIAFPGFVFAAVMTPVWTVAIFVPLLGTSCYQWLVSIAHIGFSLRIRRTLRVYPWQPFPDAVEKLGVPLLRLSLPDPETPGAMVAIDKRGTLASPWGLWEKSAKKGAVGEVWFAGDPRFAGVLALPGPKRLTLLTQPETYNSDLPARAEGIGPEARARAEAAGFRVGGA
ncbi:hypothetical protein [Streptomyces thermolineatus]|uniref:hypothetical protein n=1 Tax=Streptomyces thermolineatus TaxID=44033 RepID=UPI00384EB687